LSDKRKKSRQIFFAGHRAGRHPACADDRRAYQQCSEIGQTPWPWRSAQVAASHPTGKVCCRFQPCSKILTKMRLPGGGRGVGLHLVW